MIYLKRKLVFKLVLIIFLGLAVTCVAAESFRFTVTADSRSVRANFQHLLSEMVTLVGDEGVFHISAGDEDPLNDNYLDLVAVFETMLYGTQS